MLGRWIKFLVFLFVVCAVSGCSEQSAHEMNLDLVKIIENSGKTDNHYWLEQYNVFSSGQNGMGTWDKQVLVFGYVGNYEVCLDFIETNVKAYSATYRCVSAE